MFAPRTDFQLPRLLAATILGVAMLGLGFGVQASADIESQELQLALDASRNRLASLEAELAKEQAKNSNLGEAFAAANAESREFRDAYARLREKMEGLGLTALDPSAEALQERLLSALSDLRHVEDKNRELSDEIIGLNEAVLDFLDHAVSTSSDSKERLDNALAQSTKAIGLGSMAVSDEVGDLHGARVISLKKELDLIVLNVGKSTGARIGMPFRILRKDRPVGSALLVDVRDSISGAVLQTLVSDVETVQVGDTAKIDPNKTL